MRLQQARLLRPVHNEDSHQYNNHSDVVPKVNCFAIQHAPHERHNRNQVGSGAGKKGSGYVDELVEKYKCDGCAKHSQYSNVHQRFPSSWHMLQFVEKVSGEQVNQRYRPYSK